MYINVTKLVSLLIVDFFVVTKLVFMLLRIESWYRMSLIVVLKGDNERIPFYWLGWQFSGRGEVWQTGRDQREWKNCGRKETVRGTQGPEKESRDVGKQRLCSRAFPISTMLEMKSCTQPRVSHYKETGSNLRKWMSAKNHIQSSFHGILYLVLSDGISPTKNWWYLVLIYLKNFKYLSISMLRSRFILYSIVSCSFFIQFSAISKFIFSKL